ncbi:ComEA family DNA-binding protein [Agromyces mediolanus]|uniref:helix-hairpin-helix domain-containing protein n=1 Tax=Agromyces mediolanus TaxID=41986 RepID=UPI00383720F2
MPELPSGVRSSSAAPDDPLDLLAPGAHRTQLRTRIAVGAAVVVFIAAIAAAALLSFFGSGGGDAGAVRGGGAPAEPGTADAAGAESAAVGEQLTGTASSPVLLVHVLGAVDEPGLVELAPGARVIDAIAAAGGLAPDADPGGVNLARPVADGEQLVVPRPGEAPPPGAPGSPGAAGPVAAPDGAAQPGVVRLNTAGLAELDTLPRIGPALAQRILDWRAANGGFTSVEQLLEVAGIGDAVFAGLVDRVAL